MSQSKLFALCAVTAALVGCSSTSYTYVPAAPPGPTGGEIASLYRVPAERPRGDVEITSSGVERVHGMATLRVRLVVSNNDDLPWSIDTRRQFADIPGVGRVSPVMASTTLFEPPFIRIDPGRRAVIDLYFPLAHGVDKDDEIRDFAVAWQVQTGTAMVEDHTLFQRFPSVGPWQVG